MYLVMCGRRQPPLLALGQVPAPRPPAVAGLAPHVTRLSPQVDRRPPQVTLLPPQVTGLPPQLGGSLDTPVLGQPPALYVPV